MNKKGFLKIDIKEKRNSLIEFLLKLKELIQYL